MLQTSLEQELRELFNTGIPELVHKLSLQHIDAESKVQAAKEKVCVCPCMNKHMHVHIVCNARLWKSCKTKKSQTETTVQNDTRARGAEHAYLPRAQAPYVATARLSDPTFLFC